ncbi:MAG: phosphoglycerate mutase, partial [Syntrophorhabdus sp.]
HNGSVTEKIKAIERIDKDVLGMLLEETDKDTRILIVTDHATPIIMRTHFAVPVPFAIYDKGGTMPGSGKDYDEDIGGMVLKGEEMIRFLIGGRD